MKKIIYTLFIAAAALVLPAQTYPIIRGVTVTPAEPTDNDEVTIITTVETPYQGYKISQSQQVWHGDFKIHLYTCYYSSTQAAAQLHTDTFYVGKLDDGYWALNFESRLSLDPAVCNSTDSSDHAQYLQVDQGPLGMISPGANVSRIWPVPCGDMLFVSPVPKGTFRILSASGGQVENGNLSGDAIFTGNLAAGVYLLEFSDGQRVTRKRFVKN